MARKEKLSPPPHPSRQTLWRSTAPIACRETPSCISWHLTLPAVTLPAPSSAPATKPLPSKSKRRRPARPTQTPALGSAVRQGQGCFGSQRNANNVSRCLFISLAAAQPLERDAQQSSEVSRFWWLQITGRWFFFGCFFLEGMFWLGTAQGRWEKRNLQLG